MRYDPLFLVWTVTCPSAEDCQRLRQWSSEQLAAETFWVEEVRASPGGTETSHRVGHRLGDYFEGVRVLADAVPSPTSFRLLFHRRPHAPRIWKDLMVRVLHGVRGQAAHTTTTLEYRGDQQPEHLTAHQ